MNNFINQADPSRDISKDLENVSLEIQYSKLTSDEKLMIFLKLNGFYRKPVDIMTFISDPYYLGIPEIFGEGGSSVFDYWKGILKEIYPSPVSTKYIYSILSGSVGQGKSVMAKTMSLYTLHRLYCLKNPYKTLKVAPKTLSFYFQHRVEDTAIADFVRPIKEMLHQIPFFINIKPNFKYRLVSGGPNGIGHILGTDLIFSVQSELNFYPNQDVAKKAVANVFGRLTSRFSTETLSTFGGIVIDSSSLSDQGATNWCLENFSPSRTLYSCPNHWTVRPELYKDAVGTFPVYAGDGINQPQILPDDYKLLPDMDPDRVIMFPKNEEMLAQCKQDIVRAITDRGGFSIEATNKFLSGDAITRLVRCMKKSEPNNVPEVFTVDFYDKSDHIIDHVRSAVDLIPKGKSIVVGLDIATKKDYAGLSISGFDYWEQIGEAKIPHFKCYLATAISRKKGQETSIHHIFDFIITLRKMGYVPSVSADQAMSRQLLQDAEREGIKVYAISTDRIPCLPALFLKNLILQEAVTIPYNKRLLREAHDLRNVETNSGIKVDHPQKATQDEKHFDKNDGRGSKDVFDALSQSLYAMKLALDAGEEFGSSGVGKQLSLVTEMTESAEESSQAVFQNMLEEMW